MCDQYGYYTVTSGYRKVPGDKCYGGVDLSPTVFQCSPPGFLSFRNFMILIIFAGLVYYGWPLIEAVLIVLPIPDPKGLGQKISAFFSKSLSAAASVTKSQQKGKLDSYSKNFNQAPESLGESDDEEDLGRGNKRGQLSYDSDEDKDGNELINLDGSDNIQRDRTNTAAEQIPKLSRPKK